MLSATKDRPEPGFRQNPCYFLALVTLDFNLPILDRTARAARFLDFFREAFFFGQSNPDKICNDRDGLSAAPCRLPNDIHSASIFLVRRACFFAHRVSFAERDRRSQTGIANNG